jgi:tetratricopeptide (TPR) repeat protein
LKAGPLSPASEVAVRQLQEPSESEVISLAQQLLERDRAVQSRQSSLVAAAEEVGIPADYMAQATAQLRAQAALGQQRPAARPQRLLPVAAALALVLVMAGFSMATLRQAPAPVVAPPAQVVAPTPPVSAAGSHMDAAYVLLERGQWAAAEGEARKGIAETPDVADLHWALGKALFQEKDNAGALAASKEAMRLNPTHPAFPLLAGEVYLKIGDRKAAQKAWESVLALDGGRNSWDARTALNLMGQAGMRR